MDSDPSVKSMKLLSTSSADTIIGGQDGPAQPPCTVTRTPAWNESPTRLKRGMEAVREMMRRTMIFVSADPNSREGLTASALRANVPRFYGAVKVAVPCWAVVVKT